MVSVDTHIQWIAWMLVARWWLLALKIKSASGIGSGKVEPIRYEHI